MHGPSLPNGHVGTKSASDWAAELGSATQGYSFAPFVATRPLQAARLAKLGSITASDVVCDLGCGEAALICELVRLTGCSAIGCDVDCHALTRGQGRIDSEDFAGRVSLTHGLIHTYVQSAAFATATVCFVFLVPQQLDVLTPIFRTYLLARLGNRLLSQRFAIAGLTASDQICDESSDAASGGSAQSRDDYFGSSLGAAFLYSEQPALVGET